MHENQKSAQEKTEKHKSETFDACQNHKKREGNLFVNALFWVRQVTQFANQGVSLIERLFGAVLTKVGFLSDQMALGGQKYFPGIAQKYL